MFLFGLLLLLLAVVVEMMEFIVAALIVVATGAVSWLLHISATFNAYFTDGSASTV